MWKSGGQATDDDKIRSMRIACLITNAKPSLLYSGYWVSFPGVKRSGIGVDHPPPCNAEVKERVMLYLLLPPRPSWSVNFTFYTHTHSEYAIPTALFQNKNGYAKCASVRFVLTLPVLCNSLPLSESSNQSG
jgi:hypothetical protein